MTVASPRRVLIVGAGLAGSLLAIYLARAGWSVLVVERRHDPRERRFAEGRSINLAISARGIHALRRAGLEERVMGAALRMYGRMIHPRSGEPHLHPYSNDPTRGINSVSRSALNLALLEAAAAEPGVELLFERRCTGVDATRGTAEFTIHDTATTETFTADLVVGADGAFSAVRGSLQRTDRFDYSQAYLTHGYKEMHIPPVPHGAHAPFALMPSALHIWPRGASMMIALPNPDGSFTCTLFWPWESNPLSPLEPSFATIRSAAEARAVFERDYPDALALMPTMSEDFERNAAGNMLTVRCSPWSASGRVTLIGDAAHAVVPFYGQGANASFEDCEALVDALDAHPSIADALVAYEKARKENSDAIADMALANFVEMRDHSAKASFARKKKLARLLRRVCGNALEPEYDLVSFSTVPYAEAQARGRRNERILQMCPVVPMALVALTALVGLKWYGFDTLMHEFSTCTFCLMILILTILQFQRVVRNTSERKS